MLLNFPIILDYITSRDYDVAYCGMLNENWSVAPIIYFLNFIILGEATTN